MAWATKPESFGLDPPTGSEEERCEEAHISLAAVDAVPQALMYDTDREKSPMSSQQMRSSLYGSKSETYWERTL